MVLESRKRKIIRQLLNMNYCGSSCDCGCNSRLWFYPSGTLIENPVVSNGVGTDEIWRSLVDKGYVNKNGKVLKTP